MNPHYVIVASRARHQCEYCHAPEVIFNIANARSLWVALGIFG